MSVHHKMGMSRWTPWAVCPHFDGVEHSAAAEKGSAQHDKLCRVLNGDDTLVLDETDMADRAVAWAAKEVLADAGDEILYTEEMVEIRENVSKPLAGIYGTVDAFFIGTDRTDPACGRVIHVYDFKSMGRGMGCDQFPQLKGYALGVASMLGVTEMKTKVELHLLLGGAFRHERLSTTLFDCVTAGETIVNERKHAETAQHTPSEWCKYCRRSTFCPATDEQIEIVEGGKLGVLDIPHRLLFIEQLSGVLDKAREECKAEIAKADGKMLDGGDVCYSIREQSGASKLGKGKMLSLVDTLHSRGVKSEDIFDRCSIKKADAMKLLQATGMKLKSKDESAETAETVVAPFYEAGVVEKLERVR